MTTLIHRLVDDSRTAPHRDAMTFLDMSGSVRQSFTRAELADRVSRTAGALKTAGASGERVLLLLQSGPEFVTAFLGCMASGAVAVPAYPPPPNRRATRIESIDIDCEPRFAIATRGEWQRLDEILDPGAPLRRASWLNVEDLDGPLEGLDGPSGSVAYLQYTSGSTQSPRGVQVTHEGLMHNHAMMKDAWEQDADSVLVGWLPMFHDMGLIGVVLQSVFLGSHLVSMPPEAFLMRPKNWLTAASEYGAHTIGGPNFAYELCARKISDDDVAKFNLSALHVTFNGAEPVRAQTLRRFSDRFASCGFQPNSFYACYGLAEATLFVAGGKATTPSLVCDFSAEALEDGRAEPATDGERSHSLVSVGTSWHGQQIVIVDPSSHAVLPESRVGEIWLAGPSVAAGYLHSGDIADCFAAEPSNSAGRYLRTGDLGFVYGGELFVSGRLKDIIIIAGKNHSAEDIEDAAESSHPAIRRGRAAAFAVTTQNGEGAVLVAELNRAVDASTQLDAVVEALRSQVVAHHDLSLHAVALVSCDAIPKTSSGKIQRSTCRDMYLKDQLSVVEVG